MCKYFRREPDDDWFENLPPIKHLWMYESWRQDKEDKNEFAKAFSIFLGSFSNPEAAQKMLDKESSINSTTSSEEEFEKSWQMVVADREKKQASKKQASKKPRRRYVVE